MCLSQKFYKILVEILCDIHDLEPGASLLQADRVIARRFGVSESTARNWRRCTSTSVSPGVINSIIATCEKIAPARTADIEFIGRLSQGTQEIKIAADAIVEELTVQVFSNHSTWHIYSGPLKIAFDPGIDPVCQYQLMSRASMIMERILELGVDQTNIPSVGELIRYSTHGWWAKGFFKIREASLSSKTVGIRQDTINAIEAALYIGDGCAGPCLYSGNPARARWYTDQALDLLDTASPSEIRDSSLDLQDTIIMLRSLQATTACHEGFDKNQALITQFILDFGNIPASNEWIEGIRHEALGYIELVRRIDFAAAAYHFEQAGRYQDRWFSRFGIPFSTTPQQSLCGYALLMMQGPTDSVKAQITEGLIRTVDNGAVSDQIRARLCQSLFHDCRGEESISHFHRGKAQEMARQYNLGKWYEMLNRILLPPTVQSQNLARESKSHDRDGVSMPREMGV